MILQCYVYQLINIIMQIEINGAQDKTLVKIGGKIDTVLAAQMGQAFDEKIADGSNVEIDAKELEYITSAALRVFLALYKKMKSSGGSLTFVGVQPTVMQVFRLTGFDTFVNFKA